MQSDIFKYAITVLKDSLSNDKEVDCEIVSEFTKGKKNQVKFDVVDLFQSSNDKNGQKLIVNERRVDIPTQYVMFIRISFSGDSVEDCLSTYGKVAVYFKDHNTFECGEYSWHGSDNCKFYLEPAIRNECQNSDYLHLDYRIELQLNSAKTETFKRVEKKILNANQIK